MLRIYPLDCREVGDEKNVIEMTDVASLSQPHELDNPPPGTISVVNITLPNQTIQQQLQLQAQSVIQAAHQPSVIQTAAGPLQTIQVMTVQEPEDLGDDPEGKRRREVLARRPSYRKILNDLSADPPSLPTIAKIDEESDVSDCGDMDESADAAASLNSSGTVTTVQYQPAVMPQTIQLAHSQQDGPSVAHGLQTLTMTNAAANSSASTAQGTTIVHYAQGPEGQFYIPVSVGANLQGYQLATSSALPPGVVMATAGNALASPQQHGEEVSRKRELRLLKNSAAARACRIKKKEYVKCLENRVAVLEAQNKTLIEELKALKQLYCEQDLQGGTTTMTDDAGNIITVHYEEG